ncbi:class I SAM-dependent methyltransferase [Achromobacter aegrifaciens]|uniref:Probable S-adenosylmethionine-dependent methyltransferase MSMEG_2350 n=1 Tax=Achromobacter aegrifaciens TaxID=1287736 RepID=A0AAD2J3A3_ACHAE|nr:class I SAM-dependent methyltransferase [Achromobacter aegrifaciens]CUJ57439.1 Probable S-adenosylmethionine-dependent methyltransferase MSMEG_2350 [Achromobacter aegrifaciens]
MERLNFNESGAYEGIEAAVHIARYSFAKHCCAGKRVLDIACGEGYGSRLLANWGASAVVGVDISEEAIANAQHYFSNDKVSFLKGTAESITEQFESHSFDMIVSFETIEHVQDPVLFLRNMKALLKPAGIIAISCPNDWWYFPTEEQRNPFHLRKYHFDEFKEQAESVLGRPDAWFLGGPIFGFANLRHEGYLAADGVSGQIQMQRTSAAREAQFVPAEFGGGPLPSNASYFLGIWGAPDYAVTSNAGAAILPLSMDSFKTGVFQGHLPQKDGLQAISVPAGPDEKVCADEGFAAIGALARSVRDFGLKAEVAAAELGLMREQAAGNQIVSELYAVIDAVRVDAVKLQRDLSSFRPQLAWYREREGERVRALEDAGIWKAEMERALEELGIAQSKAESTVVALGHAHEEIQRITLEAARYRKLSAILPSWFRSGIVSVYRKLRPGKER